MVRGGQLNIDSCMPEWLGKHRRALERFKIASPPQRCSGFDNLDFERAQHRMEFIGKGLKEERYAVDLTRELIKYS